jgi:release factor glutamine methyltransferase
MNLRECIAAGAARLAAAGVPSPRHDAEALAAHVLGVGRAELLTQPDPDGRFARRYAHLISRRAAREPLQHITGVAYFRYLTLQVGPGVFVPRPETEVTAGTAIDVARRLRRSGRSVLVADLYAGSGAIGLAVADEAPAVTVHVVEADDDAVRWLRRNVDAWSPDRPDRAGTVTVHHGDVAGCLPELDGQLDVVVANPPYVPEGARIRDPEVAAYDPAAALWSGPDGLDAMRVLERTAARLLRPGGIVVAEHADVQGESAPGVFARTGRWTDVTDHLDLAGRPRHLTAVRAGSDEAGTGE